MPEINIKITCMCDIRMFIRMKNNTVNTTATTAVIIVILLLCFTVFMDFLLPFLFIYSSYCLAAIPFPSAVLALCDGSAD